MFKIKIMRGSEVVFVGELQREHERNEYGSFRPHSDDDYQAAFAIELAINQQTDLRCHVETIYAE